MSWTQRELEELYKEMQKKAMVDEGFRKELLENADAALEKLAGKKLPEGCKIKVIENDPSYTATFVLPDLISEELTPDEMDSAAGAGILVIVSACAVAIGVTGCPADACAGYICLADQVCGGEVCAGKVGTV